MRWPPTLMEEARLEPYDFFDKLIRKLPRKPDGSYDKAASPFMDGDVDAFRQTYVSGVFTQEYSVFLADIFERLNEMTSFAISTGGGIASTNMDHWNNAVGRKYGQKTRTRKTLAIALKKTYFSGEMILNLEDKRIYRGELSYNIPTKKSVIVLKESKTGRNEYFYDLSNGSCMTREDFISMIREKQYPGYRIANYHGLPTPVSKRDGLKSTNLG